MTPLKVKEKLNDFFKAYNSEAGLLNSLRVIYDYVSFLKSDPYIKGKLGDIMAYGDKQKELAITNINKIKGDLKPSFDGVADLGSLVDLMDEKKLMSIRTFGQTFSNSPNEKFLLMILCSQAKLENDNRGINVKRGLRARCERGLWPTCPPTGYFKEKRVDHKGQ